MRAVKTEKRQGVTKFVSFVEWLYCHAGDDDLLGDLATSALLDPEISLEMHQKEFLALVHARISAGAAKREVLKVVDEAVVSYRSYTNRIEQAVNLQSEKTWKAKGNYDYNTKRTYVS